MPDKYEFRRFADNLSHPWFNDVTSELKQLWLSPNRLLLCILCLLLMNIDESTFFEQESHHKHHHGHQDNHNYTKSQNELILYDINTLIITNNNNNKSYHKQCDKIPIDTYFGSKKKNIFHTQLMIGVIFGFIMKCRVPVLLTLFNIIIRSGCSFKPKILPMFIDRKELRPQTFYGSSYRLLHNKPSYDLLGVDANYYDDDSSSDEEDEDHEMDHIKDTIKGNGYEYDQEFNYNQIPEQLFNDRQIL